MRGRANDPVVRRAKASRHATRAHYCSCGKIVRGNGGKASHAHAHETRGEWRARGEPLGDKHGWITSDMHRVRVPEAWT